MRKQWNYLNTGKGTNIYVGQKKHTPSTPLKYGLQLTPDEEEVYIKLKDNTQTESLLKRLAGEKPTEISNQKDFSGFIVGAKVNHCKYGCGTIIERIENIITVQFQTNSKEVKFSLIHCKDISLLEK